MIPELCGMENVAITITSMPPSSSSKRSFHKLFPSPSKAIRLACYYYYDYSKGLQLPPHME